MGRTLTIDEKNRLYYAIMNGRNTGALLYQTPDFNYQMKVENTRTNVVNKINAVGDVAHFLSYGLTMGGLLHMACRDSSQQVGWNRVVKNATDRARTTGMFCVQNQPCTQLVVAGSKYITLYEQGEYESRIINYTDVVQVRIGREGLTFITKNAKKPSTYLSYVIKPDVIQLDKLAMMAVANCFRYYNYAA